MDGDDTAECQSHREVFWKVVLLTRCLFHLYFLDFVSATAPLALCRRLSRGEPAAEVSDSSDSTLEMMVITITDTSPETLAACVIEVGVYCAVRLAREHRV
jgi:hypothetical protein